MNEAVNVVIEDQNEYRLAWRDTITEEEGKGTFLFATPAEARDTKVAMVDMFPTYQIWLEDRQGNEIKIPKR